MERKIIDLHCDTMMRCYRGEHLGSMSGHIDLEKLKNGGILP